MKALTLKINFDLFHGLIESLPKVLKGKYKKRTKRSLFQHNASLRI
jgi:hypothetical protein